MPSPLLLLALAQAAPADPEPTLTTPEQQAEGPVDAVEAAPADAEEAAPADAVLLRNARLIDGTGAPARAADLLIYDGVIQQIGADLDPELASHAVDLQGANVTPGLIDSHVHLTFAPGQYLFDWPPEELEGHLRHHLRAYLAAGVTTVLDCASVNEDMDPVQLWLADGAPGPRLLTLGEPPAQADTYGPKVLPTLPVQDSPQALTEHLDSLVAREVTGVKVLWEDGILRPVWQLPEGEWLDTLITGAAERDLPLYVHAMSAEETAGALALRPHALVHGLRTPHADVVQAVAESGAYVVPTLHISASALTSLDPDASKDALRGLLAHPDEAAAAIDPAARELSNLAVGQVVTPRAPAWLVRRLGNNTRFMEKMLADHLEATRMLHQAGVPLVVGSDAPGWPVMLDNLPAYSTIREMELLHQVGMSAEEVLIAATQRPAEMLGQPTLGTLAPGQAADLVVLTGDPLTDIGAWRTVQYVMKGGEMNTPEGWLGQE